MILILNVFNHIFSTFHALFIAEFYYKNNLEF